MDGPLPFAGRLVAVEPGTGRRGRVSVRGAVVEVALDLVPEARPGDSVLVQAGVALALLRDEAGAPARDEAGAPVSDGAAAPAGAGDGAGTVAKREA